MLKEVVCTWTSVHGVASGRIIVPRLLGAVVGVSIGSG